MTSHPRQRPAATDYFNPAEQIQLLNSIKAKVEKSTTSTPEHHDDGTKITSTGKPLDFKAHELSLREKLEKAKAEKEARAKVELSLRTNSTNIESPQPVVQSEQTGPPPPPVLNSTPTTTTPIPVQPYPQQTWPTNLGYPNQPPLMTAYVRPPYQYPQPYQYGIQPYTNGQPQQYAQWAYGTTLLQPTPGVPPAPPQPNQGPTIQGPPNQTSPGQIPTSASPPNHVPVPMNQGSNVPPDPRFRPATIPPPFAQSTPAPIATPQIPQPPVSVPPPVQQTTPAQQQPSNPPVAQPANPVQPVNTNNETTPAQQQPEQSQPRTISPPIASAPKGPAGSIYNSATPVPRGPARLPQAQSDVLGPQPNSSKPSLPPSGPAHTDSPRGRPTSPRRDESRRYSISPIARRRTSDQYPREPFPPSSPRTQHPIPRYPAEHRDPAPRIAFATRVTTPPVRASYRDRSRSPPPPPSHHRTGSMEYKPTRPVIPDEGYRRDNWDPNRGGYKYSDSMMDARRYSPPLTRRSPPPRPASQTRYPPPPHERYPPPPEERYPPPSRDYDDYYRRALPAPPLRQRSRSPSYHRGYSPPPHPPPPATRDYPSRYYDYPPPPPPPAPVPRDPYIPPYTRPRSPTPPAPVYRDRRPPYEDYYAPPPVDYPERDYDRGYTGNMPVRPPPMVEEGYGYSREREMNRPPPRAYSPPRPPPQARGRGKRARGGRY